MLPITNKVYFLIVYSMVYGKSLGLCKQQRPENIFPQNYNKFEPPSKEGEPAHIYVDLIIWDVDSIDEEKMEYSIMIYLSEMWKDERLNLSSYTTDFKEPLIFASYLVEHIWVPDLVFDNAKDGRLCHLTLPNVSIKVLRDGTFLKESRYSLTLSCPMNLHFYPMDSQKCYFKIVSWAFPDSKVLLHWLKEHPDEDYIESVVLRYEINPLKYDLDEITSSKEVEEWPDEGNFTYLVANFVFTRRLTSAIFNVYIPSTLVILLSWISFWVDVEAVPARITLGVTSLLTLTTQVVQVHSSLPPISYLTAMDIWLFGCLIGVFSVLVEFAFAYQFFIRKEKQRITSIVYHGQDISKSKSEIHILKPILEQKANVHSTDLPMIDRLTGFNLLRGNEDLDKLCRKVFPLSFIILSSVYWTYFLSQKFENSSKIKITTALTGKN